MVSAAPASHLTDSLQVRMFNFNPATTVAELHITTTATAWQDMRDCDSLMVVAMVTAVSNDGIELLELVADTTTSFSSVTAVKAHAASTTTVIGDYVVLEINDEDLQALSTDDLRYVSVRATFDDATDNAAITFIAKPVRSYRDLTVTTTT